MTDQSKDLQSQLRAAKEQARQSDLAAQKARERVKSFTIWAAVGGFALFAIGGQFYPGYQLDSTAKQNTAVAAGVAANKVLAYLCAERFMRKDGLVDRVASLEAQKSEWEQVRFLREGEWGVDLEGKEAEYTVSEQCLNLIAKRRDEMDKVAS